MQTLLEEAPWTALYRDDGECMGHLRPVLCYRLVMVLHHPEQASWTEEEAWQRTPVELRMTMRTARFELQDEEYQPLSPKLGALDHMRLWWQAYWPGQPEPGSEEDTLATSLLEQAGDEGTGQAGDVHFYEAMNEQADALYRQGKFAEASEAAKMAVVAAGAAFGTRHPSTATGLNNLGLLLFYQHDYLQVEPFYQRALAIRQEHFGTEHTEVAQSLNNLGCLYLAREQWGRAEVFCRRAFDMRVRLLGPEHPDVGTSANNLGEVYKHRERYEEAESYYRQAHEIARKHLGADHADVGKALNNLATLYTLQGRSAEAVPLLQQALEVLKKALGGDHPHTRGVEANLAHLQGAEGAPEASHWDA